MYERVYALAGKVRPIVGLAVVGAASTFLVGACTSASSSTSPAATSSTPAGSAATGPAGSGVPARTSGPSARRSPHEVARTPVPPPQRGGIHRTVPSRAVITKAPVGLTATAVFGGGVSARLDKVRDVDGQAHIRGEVSGPALSLTVVLENDSTRPVDLTGVAVSVTGTGGRPENQLSQNGSRPFHGVLAPNATARGVYVFTVPVGDRSHIAVSISYTAAAPVVVFAGRVS